MLLPITIQAELYYTQQPGDPHLPQFQVILPHLCLQTFFFADSCWVVSAVSMVHPAGNALPDVLPLREVGGSHCQQRTYTDAPLSSRRYSEKVLS